MSERDKTDRAIQAQIGEIHRWSQGTYGVPRMHAEFAARGTHVGRKRVARLMRRAGLQGVTRRKGTFTTVRDREQQRGLRDDAGRVERCRPCSRGR
jgi:putative transposase